MELRDEETNEWSSRKGIGMWGSPSVGSLSGWPRLPTGRQGGPPLESYGSALNHMETFTELTIFLVAIILLTRLGSFISRRFNIPFVTIQLLIGILLGPSVLNLLGVPMVLGTWGSPSSGPLHSALKILAEIGLISTHVSRWFGSGLARIEKIRSNFLFP